MKSNLKYIGIAIVIISTNLKPEIVKSSQILLAMASEMKRTVGSIGSYVFLFGFWGAVTSSMLGVWQSVPYLFADFLSTWRKENTNINKLQNTNYYKYNSWVNTLFVFVPTNCGVNSDISLIKYNTTR